MRDWPGQMGVIEVALGSSDNSKEERVDVWERQVYAIYTSAVDQSATAFLFILVGLNVLVPVHLKVAFELLTKIGDY